MKKILLLIITLALFLPLLASCEPTDSASDVSVGDTSIETSSPETIKTGKDLVVGYIPLDNRPVNDQRPIYQIESAGMKILMPEEHLFATRLDGMTKNPNGTTYGDREALLEWMKENEENCDIFVVSLDQLLSGGLVSSRALTNEDLTLEYKIVDYLSELSERKPLYVFDTVMRLASTVNYNGMQMNEYNQFRSYGQKERKTLEGDELTIENIFEGYRFDKNGKKISTPLGEEQLKNYHNSRIRKLKLIDRLLRSSDNIKYCYIGVDDSSPNKSIQTNEISYIMNLIGENGTLFCGTDELGMMAVSKAYADYWNDSAKIKVTYYGGNEDKYADSFDFDTLRVNVEKHINSLGGEVVTKDADIELLVLTRDCSYDASVNLITKWKRNEIKGIKTIVIDASNTEHNFNVLLEDIPLKYTLGYSCWGTAGNAMGISLAMGYTRYMYLKNEPNKTETADEAFAKGLVFAFVKDMSYCRSSRSSLNKFTPEAIESHLMRDDYRYNAPLVISKLIGEKLISDNDGNAFTIPKIELTDFTAPFERQYEIRFQVEFE